jgi:hypothetical protein
MQDRFTSIAEDVVKAYTELMLVNIGPLDNSVRVPVYPLIALSKATAALAHFAGIDPYPPQIEYMADNNPENGLVDISELYDGGTTPWKVQASFSLPYRGWCQLKESAGWRHLLIELGRVQNDETRPEIPSSEEIGIDELRDAVIWMAASLQSNVASQMPEWLKEMVNKQ